MLHRKSQSVPGLVAALLLTACASGGGGAAGGTVEGRPEYGEGIQTRSIRAAPATREAQNESLPLSELNTPEAIAARQSMAPSARGAPSPASRPVAASAPPASATAATEAVLAASTGAGNAHVKAPSLQKGSKVRVRSGAPLHSRPNASSVKLMAIAVNGEIELGPQVYNADGYWWFIQLGKETGWLLQTDILR